MVAIQEERILIIFYLLEIKFNLQSQDLKMFLPIIIPFEIATTESIEYETPGYQVHEKLRKINNNGFIVYVFWGWLEGFVFNAARENRGLSCVAISIMNICDALRWTCLSPGDVERFLDITTIMWVTLKLRAHVIAVRVWLKRICWRTLRVQQLLLTSAWYYRQSFIL